MDYLLLSGLAASLIVNLVMGVFLLKKKHVITVDAKKILAEIANGRAILDIKVIDASGLFYRSPRG